MTVENQLEQPEPLTHVQFFYSVADINILLEPDIKTEVLEEKTTFPFPHAPAWCSGMISLRGKLIPVINIHRLTGKTLTDQSSWMLILEASNFPPVAIQIDQLPRQLQFMPKDVTDMESKQLPFWFIGKLENDNRTLYQVDHAKLLSFLAIQNQQVSDPQVSSLGA